MTFFNTPLGQAFITLTTAGIVALVATVIKILTRMSRVEGKLELLFDMVAGMRDANPADPYQLKRKRTQKGTRNYE